MCPEPKHPSDAEHLPRPTRVFPIFAGFRAGMAPLVGDCSPLDFIPTKRFSTMSMRPTPCLPLPRRREVGAAPQWDAGGCERWVGGGQTMGDKPQMTVRPAPQQHW